MDKETQEFVLKTLDAIDAVLRDNGPSDGTKLYWVGRAISDIGAKIRPFVEAEAA